MGKTGNLAGSLAGVNGTLASGFGEQRSSLHEGFLGSSLIFVGNSETHSLHGILGAGADSAIAAGLNKALAMTLKGGRMISHDDPPIKTIETFDRLFPFVRRC